MSGWERALAAWLEAGDRQDGWAGIEWMVVGSAATRLQGAQVEPGDVDVLVHPDTTDEAMERVAGTLAPLASDRPGGEGSDDFRSTPGHPLLAEAGWLFGRWLVADPAGGLCKLEVARIRELLETDQVVETLGRPVWRYRRWVGWGNHRVPVVRLEVQAATMLLRGQDERLAAVRATKVPGWDEDLAVLARRGRGLAR